MSLIQRDGILEGQTLMNSQSRRNRLFIEPEIQGAIIRRVVLYWTCCLLFINLPLLIAQVLSNPDLYFFQQIGVVAERHWPTYLCLLGILPFVVLDAVRVSNRFVGPIVRIQKELSQLADGDTTRNEISFRDGDYWTQLGSEFNRVAERIRVVSSELDNSKASVSDDTVVASSKA